MIHESRNIALHSYDDHYRRFGIATLPWSALSACSAQAVKTMRASLTSGSGGEFHAQVDAVDPDDRSLDVLSIYGEWIKGGGVHTGLQVSQLQLDYSVDDTTSTAQQIAGAAKTRAAAAARTTNYYLRIDAHGHVGAFIYLPAQPHGWQGGAITSIQIDGKEILDAPAAERGAEGHDYEKRLQLDRVAIANPPWSTTPVLDCLLYKEPWSFVAAGSGPVRAWVNIRSPKFTFEYADPHDRKTTYDCHLYRVISAFRRSDFLIEDLYVKGTPVGSSSPIRLNFAAHYFLKMQFGDSRHVAQVPVIPDWFAIGTHEAPRPGFGFASTAPCVRIDHPPPDYTNPEGRRSAFGWQLGYAYSVRCLHLFRRWSYPVDLENDIGRAWFEMIYRPLKARVV